MKHLMLKMVASIIMVCVFASGAMAADCVGGGNGSAADIISKACQQDLGISGCDGGDKVECGENPWVATILNAIIFIAGLISVVFLIIGGVKYMTSTGDSSRIQGAKDTVLYAVIGIIATLLAVPISGYVIQVVNG